MKGHDVGATVAFADYTRDVDALRKQLADAQATVEALRAQLESANALLYKKNCAIGKAETTIEALQRERDEARRKYHEAMDIMSAWKNIDHAEAVARLLEANKALDAEREKVKGLETVVAIVNARSAMEQADLEAAWLRVRELEAEHRRDAVDGQSAMELLQFQLSQLQALVRALPVVRIELNGAYHDTLLARPEDDAVKELLRYRASLDATTPDSNQLGAINDMVSKGGDGE